MWVLSQFEKMDILRRCPPFKNLPADTLRSLAQLCREVEYAAGQTIMVEDSRATNLFVLAHGSLVVRTEGREVARLGPTALLGDMEALSPPKARKYIATVEVASTQVQGLEMHLRHLRSSLQRHPDLALSLISNLSARCMETGDRLARIRGLTQHVERSLDEFSKSLVGMTELAEAMKSAKGMKERLERKYKVSLDTEQFSSWTDSQGIQVTSQFVEQAYLPVVDDSDGERDDVEVRIRRIGDEHTLTMSRRGSGAARQEAELELTDKQYQTLLPLAKGHPIRKTRYKLEYGGLDWKLDEFSEETQLAGLQLAEVALPREGSKVRMPPLFVGDEDNEVTDDPSYRNLSLAMDGRPTG